MNGSAKVSIKMEHSQGHVVSIVLSKATNLSDLLRKSLLFSPAEPYSLIQLNFELRARLRQGALLIDSTKFA